MNFKIVVTLLFLFNIQRSFQQACNAIPNIDYFGNDLPGGPCPAASSDECCALCQANPQCQAWTFACDPVNPSCSKCYLKCAVGSDIRCLENRFSGVKQQCRTTTPNCVTTAITNCFTTACSTTNQFLCAYFNVSC